MKIAVLPGSFDPFTLAHKDLVDRGLGLFDKIIIAIGVNINKKGLMDFELRKQAIAAVYADNPKIVVESFTGLTVDLCEKLGANYILRGLRNSNDLLYEDAIAQSGTSHISSTIVRDIWSNKGKIDHLVPKEVLEALSR